MGNFRRYLLQMKPTDFYLIGSILASAICAILVIPTKANGPGIVALIVAFWIIGSALIVVFGIVGSWINQKLKSIAYVIGALFVILMLFILLS